MPRRPRRPARSAAVSTASADEQAKLIEALFRAHPPPPLASRSFRSPRQSVRDVERALGVQRRRGRVTIQIGPLRLSFREADAEDVFERLGQSPTWPGSELFDRMVLVNVPRVTSPPRGRHARRAESGVYVRTRAAGVYVTLQQRLPHEPWLGAMLLTHARQRHPALSGSLRTRTGRWNVRELTAYVVEFGLAIDRRALGGGLSPTEDPERFYDQYVRGEMLGKARALLKRVGELRPVSAAIEALQREVEEAKEEAKKAEVEGTKSTRRPLSN